METTKEPGQKPKWVPVPPNVRTFLLPLQVLCKNPVYVGVEDKIFMCNKVVLVANCQIFTSTLEIGHTLQLTASCLTAQMFRFAYGWMVTNHVAIPYEEMVNMLMVADFLKCSPLEKSILTMFNDVDSYSVKDSVRFYFEAIEKGEKGDRLARQMLPRVGHSFLILVASKEFAKLTAKQLYDLLSSTHLAVHSEIEVVYAVLYWLREDYKNRRKHEKYLFGAVRFSLLPSYIIPLWTTILMKVSMEMEQMMRMFFKLFQAEINELESKRIWIKDPLCPYLNHMQLESQNPLLLNAFGDYLQLLNAEPEATFLSRIEVLSPEIPPAVPKEKILENILQNIYENILSSS